MGITGAGILHRLPFAAGGGGWADAVSGTNFPPPSSANFTYGTLDFSQTNLLFKFLKQDGCSKLVQAPKILALDNQEATIFVGESVRYARSNAASNQNGGLTFSVSEDQNSPVNVGFQLLVIPHVIPGENKIMMLVIPQQRALSGTTSTIPGFDRFIVSGPVDRPAARGVEHARHADDPARQRDRGHRRPPRGPRHEPPGQAADLRRPADPRRRSSAASRTRSSSRTC